MDLGLQDRVALITGASGGIGQALAAGFTAEGARVALQARQRHAALEAFAAESLPPDSFLLLSADVTRPAEIEGAIDQAALHFGRLDACIVNAGIWPPESLRLDQLSPARIRETLEVDLLGAIWTARAFMQQLARRKPAPARRGASLTLIGSTAGRFGERGHADYAVSKAGLYGLVRSLKNEIVALDPEGRVNMVEPGWTATPMAEGTLHDRAAIRRAIRTMPLQRVATAADIARAVLFLSSPAAAAHITGEVLTVAGGMEGRVQWESEQVDAAGIQRRLGIA
ncbi:MAG: SDR family oxidoreductase [Candidatus Eisenbacteria sp.]|nr:SDR family oxidoreductase [Candidatus Eisenbacteria bacterium]